MIKIDFNVGDTVKVITRDLAEQKTAKTPFEGIVIALRGIRENRTFTIRRQASQGVAVERIFSINSPNIENVKVVKTGKVRRAKLYYLRNK